ncbi:5'/3'-nucleotidase SurE [Caenispirillum bisanense]|uniref:5'-nucleotidase SurE n=1 Tax=Caenispirillum bisanense TaxID=414052 RepID=A0A286H036_9PROT|nr:5'/3'-nucleotidase SurE [Caenispirillum bisanense]SOE01111.1 5'-nucleotidase /3'-nucleotidase /exopolyphosphatase [Caenispirillum bisanense]
MFEPVTDLSTARILVSNDDGIHAPGIALLEEIALSLSDDVWVVAPETEQSGTAHSLTLHHPLRYRQVAEKRFAVDGTPTDSVLLAVNKLVPDRKPTLLLSGINRGANLGDDVTYSGTIAAAIEGTLLGVPSIALSQIFRHPDPVPWETARAHAARVIRACCAQGWARNVTINVNFPNCAPDAVAGVEVVRQGKRKLGDGLIERHDPRGRPYVWIGPQRNEETTVVGTDIEAVGRNVVSVTPLCVDLTHEPTMLALKQVLR